MLMRARYDERVDALYIMFRARSKPGILLTEDLGSGIYLDRDLNDRVVGLEVLDASCHFSKEACRAMDRSTAKRMPRRPKRKKAAP